MPAVAIEQTETKAKEFTFQSDSPADDAAWLNNAIEQQRICAADSVEAADGKVVLKWKRHANKNSVSKWLKSVLGAAKCPVPNGDVIEVKKELKKEPEKEPKRELKQEPEQEPARQLKREPKKEPESELTTVPETEPEPRSAIAEEPCRRSGAVAPRGALLQLDPRLSGSVFDQPRRCPRCSPDLAPAWKLAELSHCWRSRRATGRSPRAACRTRLAAGPAGAAPHRGASVPRRCGGASAFC